MRMMRATRAFLVVLGKLQHVDRREGVCRVHAQPERTAHRMSLSTRSVRSLQDITPEPLLVPKAWSEARIMRTGARV
jgi:hypothetical protein